jgi:hypothetical protein
VVSITEAKRWAAVDINGPSAVVPGGTGGLAEATVAMGAEADAAEVNRSSPR